MPNTFQCPACGGLIEYTSNNQDMACPFCGTTVTTPGLETAPEASSASAATFLIPKTEREPAAAAETVIQHSRFNNSAEIMDEVKRLLRADDKAGAIKVYRKEFNLPLADAQTSVDQIEIEMQHSGKETPPAEPESAPPPAPAYSPIPDPAVIRGEVLDATPQKPSSTRNWLIGCGIALIVFCCFCVVLPSIVWVVMNRLGN